MAGAVGVITGTGILRSGVTCLARVRGNSGALITRASLSTIAYAVRDLTNATTITSAQSITINNDVFNDLQQNDPRWDRDSANAPGPDGSHGYNFRTVIAASRFTNVDVAASSGVMAPNEPTVHKYQIAITFTPTTGEAWIVPFEAYMQSVWVS